MTYKVVKKVKGHYYLYSQESYRVGRHVKTNSQYLGKIDESYAKSIKNNKSKNHSPNSESNNIDIITEKTFGSTVTSISINNPKSKYPPTTMKAQFSMFSDKKQSIKNMEYPYLKIKTKAKLSHSALWSEYRKNINGLSENYDLNKMPKITIKTGNEIGIKKRKNLNYILTIQNKKGIRTLAKKEYSKIFARIELDLMKSQNPRMYDKLKFEFQESLKETKKHLKTFVKNHDNHLDKESYNIGLSMFNYANEVKKTKRGKSTVETNKLGFGYSGKLNFENEFTYLRQQNPSKLKKQISSQIRGCKSAITRHEKKKVSLIRKSKQKRDIKALKSRIKLHGEMLKRIEILKY